MIYFYNNSIQSKQKDLEREAMDQYNLNGGHGYISAESLDVCNNVKFKAPNT